MRAGRERRRLVCFGGASGGVAVIISSRDIACSDEHQHCQRLAVRREGAGQCVWLNQSRLSAARRDAAESLMVAFAAAEVDARESGVQNGG